MTRTTSSRRLIVSLALFTAAWHTALGAEPAGKEVHDFYNVIAPEGADPWIIRHSDGRYYAMVTTGVNLTLIRSDTISGLGGGETKVVWEPARGDTEGKNIWAPEIHFLEGKWYIYAAADNGKNARHRMFAFENPSADPFEGRFVLKGKVHDPAVDRWAIDGTVLSLNKRLYFIWSGWEGTRDVRQDLYIAPMSNPWTLAGPRVKISEPTFDWEKRGGPPSINEGPQALVHDGRVFIVYSAAGSWTDHYCLGMLTASEHSNLLDPRSWRKNSEPVFAGANRVIAPGHCSFVSSPDGTQPWILYHSARYPGAGWTRLVRAQPFSWGNDGVPIFGEPAPPDRSIALPSGEPAHMRFEAENAILTGSAHSVECQSASGDRKVVSIDTPGASLTFELKVETAGTYVASIRSANGSPREAVAVQHLSTNGQRAADVRYENNGRDRWSNVFVRLDLTAGLNRVQLTHSENSAELDCLDLISLPTRSRATPAR